MILWIMMEIVSIRKFFIVTDSVTFRLTIDFKVSVLMLSISGALLFISDNIVLYTSILLIGYKEKDLSSGSMWSGTYNSLVLILLTKYYPNLQKNLRISLIWMESDKNNSRLYTNTTSKSSIAFKSRHRHSHKPPIHF